MKVLACTGGIGSGKTYISQIFSNMGIPVYYSDDRTKLLYNSNHILLEQMIKLLGRDIVKDGILQRKIVAQKIFNNKELLAKVEELVHPAVVADFNKWKEEIMQNKDVEKIPFVIFESAIILEKPLVRGVADKVLTVSSPLQVRIDRVIRRDNVSMENVMERITAQWDDNKREAIADFIIFADGKQALLPQIISVNSAMCKL